MELLTKYNYTSVFVFVISIVLAHLFASNLYDWKNNTISELASQQYEFRWLMKTGFILFGFILSVGITNKLIHEEGELLKELPILIYGLAILVSGLYSTKPFIKGLDFSVLESKIHSYSAQIAGMMFSIGLLIHFFLEKQPSLKVVHFATFVFVIGLSALFGLSTSNVGIIQRVMYLVSFVWLVWFYNK